MQNFFHIYKELVNLEPKFLLVLEYLQFKQRMTALIKDIIGENRLLDTFLDTDLEYLIDNNIDKWIRSAQNLCYYSGYEIERFTNDVNEFKILELGNIDMSWVRLNDFYIILKEMIFLKQLSIEFLTKLKEKWRQQMKNCEDIIFILQKVELSTSTDHYNDPMFSKYLKWNTDFKLCTEANKLKERFTILKDRRKYFLNFDTK